MQGAFDFRSPATWIEDIYAATRETVEEHFGQDALAADMGVSRQLMGLRLARKQDTKGDTQRLHLDVLGHLFADPAARWKWLERLCGMCGAKPPQPLVALTAAEKLRIVAGELPERRRRALEREHGLPQGSLDP